GGRGAGGGRPSVLPIQGGLAGDDSVGLGASPEVHRRHAMDAAHRAVGCAGFGRRELASNVVDRIRLERHGWVTPLVGAVMHESILADVEVSRPRTATPVVGFAVRQVFLKPGDARVEILEHLPGAADRGRDAVEYLTFDRPERLQPS